ncbi:MAG: metal ABC transporter permease [Thermodesulfobacteriota bacterium]|nr:metal ABC transporter permease [Thermodesulfobacteriota bacterium]
MEGFLAGFQFEFMRNALFAGLLASFICGVVGTYVVVNRIVFLSGGIAHAAYGGVGLAFFLGLPLLPCTLVFSTLVALVMAVVTLKSRHRADTVIGVIWALGMAFGVILVDLTPGYNVDLMSYLFGSILAVPASDLWVMLGLGGVILVIVTTLYGDLLTLSYDMDFAQVRGIPVTILYGLLVVLVALSVVVVIRMVGLILVIALLTIAPHIAERHSKSLAWMMALATAFNVGFTLAGLFLSYRFDLTSGATIILVAGTVFFLSFAWKRRGQPAA